MGSTIKVLIVDDEYLVRFGLRTTIDWEQYGYEIAGEASDGQEALELALTIRPDLIITDISMPFLDGIGFMEQLRQHETEVKIIVLTGYGDFNYARGALMYGASDYILKPVENNKLIETIKKLAVVIHNERITKQIMKEKLFTDLLAILKKICIQKTIPTNRFVEDAIKYIKQHYSEELSVGGIADKLFISSSYLMHLFKENTGMTVNDFITGYRIERAKSLLKTHEYKIYEVSIRVGFQDQRYFGQLFKKHVRLTPSEYIRSLSLES
ncbi:response regulator transcription factor [Paenibacillus eucommiae]|uniref:Two-component system response regulator YesN n=1 Tax=Paenibacillus eucommiae TaxID=1355755 RepID=A0ABS4IRN7_9BACL|nr:response regulator [Paenibacillus eucommiae]MBP1990240.1 two-component system response regulator YesN [Paenibacillus eucommiae]